MFVRIEGIDMDDVMFTIIVEADTISEVQDELDDIMLLVAADVMEFEDLIKDLGFTIAPLSSEIIGTARIQVITEISTTF